MLVLPTLGARIVSLTDAVGHEWLVQPDGEDVLRLDAGFASVPPYGWDEMMPSIEACVVHGVDIGDHGAVWNVPWRVAKDVLRVEDPRYTFSRSTSPTPKGFDLHYALVAHVELSALWAPHPLFLAPAGIRFGVGTGVGVGVGTSWVRVDDQSGSPTGRVVLPSELPPGRSQKFYARSPVSSAWLQDGMHRVKLAWDPSVAAYLGVFSENCHYTTSMCMAIEPSTSWYDALDRAVENSTALQLAKGERLDWSLTTDLSHNRS